MYVYNPEGFEPKAHLPEHLHPYSDCARVLVHLIECGSVFNRLHDDEFVPRKAAYLRNLVHKERYLEIRDALRNSGVIELLPHYIVGKRSYGFRIGEKFKEVAFKRYQISDKKVIRRLQKHRLEHNPPLTDPIHQGLRAWLEHLEVDYKSGLAFLHSTETNSYKFHVKLLSLAMLHDKEVFFKPDAYGRVHTNLTNLARSLRCFLSYKSESLVNIDIGNSQPLFFGIIVSSNFRSSTYNTKINTKFLPPSPTPLHYDAEGNKCVIDAYPSDLMLFMKCTEEARFYEVMMEELKVPLNGRTLFKKEFFGKVFYCSANYYTKERAAFKKHFPTVLEHLLLLKKDDPRNAPLTLQRVESKFVIGTVCKRILLESPETPIWTIHDSIATTQSNGENVRSVMQQEFLKLGVKPRLTIEEFVRPVTAEVSPRPLRAEVSLTEIGNGLLFGDSGAITVDPERDSFSSVA